MKMSVTLHDHYVVKLKQFSGLNSFELVVTVRLKADDNNLLAQLIAVNLRINVDFVIATLIG